MNLLDEVRSGQREKVVVALELCWVVLPSLACF
jgi:hypothetical protein